MVFHNVSARNPIKLYNFASKLEKSGKWLAGQLGKSTCTVSKWCSNTTQPDLQTLDKIAKLLDVNVKALLNDTEKR